MFVKCGISGSEFSALVDSGASMNFMSKALVHKLGWDVKPSNKVSVRLADGTIVNSV